MASQAETSVTLTDAPEDDQQAVITEGLRAYNKAQARWLTGERADVEDFSGKYRGAMAADIDEQPVFLAKSAWEIGYVTERFPKVGFERTKERA